MTFRTYKHPKIVTKDGEGKINGFLVPIYNMHDGVVAG